MKSKVAFNFSCPRGGGGAVFLNLVEIRFQNEILTDQTSIKNTYRVSEKKGIDKNLLFGAAQGFDSRFLNLYGFSISVSFVWCIT